MYQTASLLDLKELSQILGFNKIFATCVLYMRQRYIFPKEKNTYGVSLKNGVFSTMLRY